MKQKNLVGFNMVNFFNRLRQFGQLAAISLIFVCYAGTSSQVVGLGIDDRESLLGNYLAGRYAMRQSDVDVAIKHVSKALEQDPESTDLIGDAFLLGLKAADWDKAKKYARKLIKAQPNHFMGRLFLGVVAVQGKNYPKARQHLAKSSKAPFAALTVELVMAWTLVAENKTSQALDHLKEKQGNSAVRYYRHFHRALIADYAKRHKIANEEYNKVPQRFRSLRIIHAHALHKAKQGKIKDALNILKPYAVGDRKFPQTAHIYNKLKKGEKPGLLVKSPSEGMAEVLYTIGTTLVSERAYDLAIIYLKMAIMLNPKMDEARNSLGNAYERTNKYKTALKHYQKVSKDSPLWPQVQIRQAVSYNVLDNVEKAKKLLEELAALQPNEIGPLDTLGNLMRNHKRYKEAIVYYDRAIALIKKPEKKHWHHYYSRGVCYERLGQWKKAEVDLQMANKLDPNRPLVLNYLGYSWVDQNINLDKAMKLIRKAVRLKPNDGYFVDSLGWAHYRLGNYKEAVKDLERAVLLKPDDPVINDHLGDAYWKIGRRLEAKYQWSQALSLKPEEKVKKEILRKLKEGLEKQDKKNSAQLKKKEKEVIKK